MAVYQISTADHCPADEQGGAAREAALQRLIDRVALEARRQGWPGMALADFDWIEPAPEARVQAPMAAITVWSGHGTVSVDDLRAAIAEKIAARKRQRKQEELFA